VALQRASTSRPRSVAAGALSRVMRDTAWPRRAGRVPRVTAPPWRFRRAIVRGGWLHAGAQRQRRNARRHAASLKPGEGPPGARAISSSGLQRALTRRRQATAPPPPHRPRPAPRRPGCSGVGACAAL
jgi:hypothetical protein